MVICFCYFCQLSLLVTGSEKYSFVVVASGTLQQFFEIENLSLFNFFFFSDEKSLSVHCLDKLSRGAPFQPVSASGQHTILHIQ